jgi:hypothetical protein
MPQTKPTTIDEYIACAPMEAQAKLREIRSILKKVAPKALIKKIAEYRARDVRENDALWMG